MTQRKKIKEYELCTRYLQSFFQSLFDSDENNNIFKWINTITFGVSSNEEQIKPTKNRPDGCFENDLKTIGFIEVKTVDNATNHNKVNVDLHRLGLFAKTAIEEYNLNAIFTVMAVGKHYI